MLGGWVFRGRGVAAALGGVCALVALECSAASIQTLAVQPAPVQPTTVTHADPSLFAAAYRAILNHYIEPLSSDALALAGLQGALAIDPTLSVAREGDRVVLKQWRNVLLETVAPAADDLQGWGWVTATMLDRAKLYSPDISAKQQDALDQSVIDGGLKLLDRFSRYAPPEVATTRRDNRDGYGGIGVTLDGEGAGVRIAMVMPDSPASAAGLAGGDRITAVDGVTAAQMPAEGIAERLRGPVGTNVRLTLQRDGRSYPVTVNLRRSHIVMKTVSMTHDDHVAVLRVASFNARTADYLEEQIAEAHREMGANLKGLVLDLRGNPGGLVDQSVLVASLFLEGGRVVSTRGRVPESNQIFDVTRDRPAEALPLVVLVNGGSASASEIVAAALQDEHRAVIVGTSSYGKGTVQDVIHLPNQGELTVTWAKLIPPGGYILHHHGVVPVVCTAHIADATQAEPQPGLPRRVLDDHGWDALRAQCPASRIDRAVDLEVAERLLTDPARYAQALAYEPAKPIQAASNMPVR
jgi:carboxyl-terminal processing protease